MSKKYLLRQTEKYFQNVDGKDIKLIVNYYETKRSCVEIIIEDVNKDKTRRNCIFVCLIAVINIISLCLNLFHEAIFCIIFTIISFIIIKLILQVRHEKLLIVKSLGIQSTVSYVLGSQSTNFIPWDTVQKIFINEVITLQRVLFFLTIMTKNYKDNESLVPLFKHTKPRLKCLEIIFKQMEDILS